MKRILEGLLVIAGGSKVIASMLGVLIIGAIGYSGKNLLFPNIAISTGQNTGNNVDNKQGNVVIGNNNSVNNLPIISKERGDQLAKCHNDMIKIDREIYDALNKSNAFIVMLNLDKAFGSSPNTATKNTEKIKFCSDTKNWKIKLNQKNTILNECKNIGEIFREQDNPNIKIEEKIQSTFKSIC